MNYNLLTFARVGTWHRLARWLLIDSNCSRQVLTMDKRSVMQVRRAGILGCGSLWGAVLGCFAARVCATPGAWAWELGKWAREVRGKWYVVSGDAGVCVLHVWGARTTHPTRS